MTAAFLVAGTIKGAVGIGLPTASIGIMTQAIDPRIAIALVVFPIIVSNFWQVLRMGETLRAVRDYWLLAASLMVVLWLTTSVTAAVSQTTLMIVVGTVIIIFAVSSLALSPPVLPDRFNRIGQFAAGIAAGALGGLTSIWSPPLVTYFIARRLDKDEFIRASGLLIFLGSLPLCIGFWQEGLLNGPNALLSAAMVVPALIGFQVGEVLRRKIRADRFQIVVLVVFLLMGLNVIRKALQ